MRSEMDRKIAESYEDGYKRGLSQSLAEIVDMLSEYVEMGCAERRGRIQERIEAAMMEERKSRIRQKLRKGWAPERIREEDGYEPALIDAILQEVGA